jgi:hypothetical protein
MICKNCVTGGMLNLRGLYLVQLDRSADAKGLFNAAESMHDECRGCDCQHTVGMKMVQ